MNKNIPPIDFSPSLASRRTLWLIFISAVLMLLIIAGKNGLVGKEEDIAYAVNRLLAGKDIFSADAVDKFSDMWFSRGRMLAALLCGSDEFGLRILSAVSGLLLLSGTMLLADEYFDRKTMCSAAWMLIGSYGFIYWGRFCGSYMTLAAWAIWIPVVLLKIKFEYLRYSIFFLLLFTGTVWWGMNFLLLLPGVMIIGRNEKGYSRHWGVFIAGIMSALITSALIFALQIWNNELPAADHFCRFIELFNISFTESLRTSVYPGSDVSRFKAALNLPRLLFPWTLPAAVAVAGMIWKWKKVPTSLKRFIIGTFVILLLTGIFPCRRWQYQLPQLPFFIMLCAAGVAGEAGVIRWQRFSDKVMKWAFIFIGSFAASAFVLWPLWSMIFSDTPPWLIIFGVSALGFTALAFLVFDTGHTSAVEKVSGMNGPWSGYILAGVSLSAAVLCIAMPILGTYRSGRIFWTQCSRIIAGEAAAPVIFYGSEPDKEALYYLDLSKDVAVIKDPEELIKFLDSRRFDKIMLFIRHHESADAAILKKSKFHSLPQKPLYDEAELIYFDRSEEAAAEKYMLYIFSPSENKNIEKNIGN